MKLACMMSELNRVTQESISPQERPSDGTLQKRSFLKVSLFSSFAEVFMVIIWMLEDGFNYKNVVNTKEIA